MPPYSKPSASQKPHAFTTLLNSLPPTPCPISWPSTSTLKSALACYRLEGGVRPRAGLEANCGFFSTWSEVHMPLMWPHLTPLLCYGAGTFLVQKNPGFNRAGDLGRIPVAAHLFHELFNENKFSSELLKLNHIYFFAQKYSLYIQTTIIYLGSRNSPTDFTLPAFPITQFQPRWFIKTFFGLSRCWKVSLTRF